MTTKIAHDLNIKERTKDVTIDEEVNFSSLLLSEDVLKGLDKNGFVKPSPIQLKAIPLGKCGFDLIVQSKSGTGKTAVFAVIALEMIDTTRNDLQVLIIAPTREIALQTQDVIKAIGSEKKDLQVGLFIGGLPLDNDIQKAKHCHIAVGAPGRLKNIIENGHLNTKAVRLFILDEADKLIDSNLQTDINVIYHKTPKRKQVLALSATYNKDLEDFVARYMQSPTHVSPNTDTPILLGLRQYIYEVKSTRHVMNQIKIKTEALIKLLSEISYTQCLIFTNYQVRVESLCTSLEQQGWAATSISGAQAQSERIKAINALKKFKCRILLSTDLTARGIDAANVDLVINFDVPPDASTYLHRMGRAGRYGSKGLCITIITHPELLTLQNILGEIGGNKLSIPKLSSDNFPNDIWSDDLSSLEVVYGTMPEKGQQKISDILDSVLTLKSDKLNAYETIHTEKVDDLEELSTKEVKCMLEKNKQKETDLSYSQSDINTDLLLKSLATGKEVELAEENDQNISSEEALSCDFLLQQLACGVDPLKTGNTETIVNDTKNEINKTEGVILMDTESDTQFDTVDILKQIASGKIDENTSAGMSMENKKRKRNPDSNIPSTSCLNSNSEQTHLHEAKRTTTSKNKTLNKNIALLNLTKLLVEDESIEISDELKATTNNIIQIVKEDFENTQDEISEDMPYAKPEEILRKVIEKGECESLNNKEGCYKKEIYCDDVILKMAFDFALDRISENWIEHIDISLDDPVKSLSLEKLSIEDSCKGINLLEFAFSNERKSRHIRGGKKQRKSNNYYSKNKNSKNHNTDRKQKEVKQQNSTDKEEYCNNINRDNWCQNYYNNQVQAKGRHIPYEQYESYFQNYEHYLSTYSDYFEDVASFDNWFADWKYNLRQLRDYVQQNIYVQEMSRLY